MNRDQPLVDHAAAQALIDAAIERFHQRGYAGSSVSEIAADAGLSRADLYAHFPSKLTILSEIAQTTYGLGLARVEVAVEHAGEDPRDRLDAAIWSQCDFVIRCRHALHVIDTELCLLERSDRDRVRAAKDRLGQLIGEIVADGVLLGAFTVDRPAVTSQALLGMCASIGSWYPDDADRSPRQIAETYCELATRMTGATPGARGRRLVAVPELQIA